MLLNILVVLFSEFLYSNVILKMYIFSYKLSLSYLRKKRYKGIPSRILQNYN